jgi:photosystem II stability/assembly factor-like uncharacterized protein
MSTGNQQTGYVPKILKTTNGGNNWLIIKEYTRMYSFQVLDSVTVYGNVRGGGFGYESIYRTFDGGITWDSVSYSTVLGYTGLFFLDRDTGYIGASDSQWAYLLKTTNGGVTLDQIFIYNGSTFGEELIFFNEKVNGEYYGYCTSGQHYMFKTTNSGYNWTQLTGGLFSHPSGYSFLNKDTGWVGNRDNFSHNFIQYTADGGMSWSNQSSSAFNNNAPYTPYFVSGTKGWAGTGSNKIYATTDGGQVWGRQPTPSYLSIWNYFVDSLNAWACGGGENIISHTTNGGGVILGITKDSSFNIIPKNYILKQNYPNPFNNNTIIEYSLIKKATIGINIYDISGRSVYDMTANNLEPGKYKLSLDFGVLNLPSGIYFYKFIAVNDKGIQQYSETKKLMYVK